MERKELLILQQFRKNARENLTRTSRRTGIPVSTIYKKKKKYQGTLIKKHTVLLDFSQLGYALKVIMAMKVPPAQRSEVTQYLHGHHRINSLYKITSGYDVMVEAIFRNLKEYQIFCESIDKFPIQDRQEFFIIEDIKQEEFLANDAYLDILEEQL